MYLARVTGRVVTSAFYEGLAGVPLQWIQPLDEDGAPMGPQLVAHLLMIALILLGNLSMFAARGLNGGRR